MEKKLKCLIDSADIPQLLKNYLTRDPIVNQHFNKDNLNKLESAFIEYDTLYEFNETEFCYYVIKGLKKWDHSECVYYHINYILDESLNVVLKQFNMKNIKHKSYENMNLIHENHIYNLLTYLDNSIRKFKNLNDLKYLINAYEISGILDLLFKLYPQNRLKEHFQKKREQLDELLFK